MSHTRTALVIGATGGIGAALVKGMLTREPDLKVVATWHQREPDRQLSPERVAWVELDASSHASVASLANELTEKALVSDTSPLVRVINTVGLLHQQEMLPEKSLRAFQPAHFNQVMQTNCLPTLLLAQALAPLLKSGEPAVFAAISARVGSISDNQLGGWYSYRISKAALNMALRTLAVEWQRSHRNVCVAALHPGTTDTGLSEPFQKNVPNGKLFSPEQTAGYLLDVIDTLEPAKTGRFWAYDGSEIPW